MLTLKLAGSLKAGVQKFRETNVDRLSVVTGVNGTGKTRLFKSIANGEILSLYPSGKRVFLGDIFFYESSLQRWFGSTEEYFHYVEQKVSVISDAIHDCGVEAGALGSFATESQKSRHLELLKPRLIEILGPVPAGKLIRAHEEGGVGLGDIVNAVRDLYGNTPGAFMQGELDEAFAAYFVQFQTVAHDSFIQYVAGGEPERDLWGMAEAQFGQAPWTILNTIFGEAGIPLRAERPEMDWDPKKLCRFIGGGGELVSVADLSSGERVFAALGLGLIQSKGATLPAMPRLLLLDEIDAALHPSWVRILLNVLQKLSEEWDVWPAAGFSDTWLS